MRNLAILGTTGIIVIIAVGVTIFFLTRGDSTPSPTENLVIVIDRSSAMGNPLEGATKLEVAIGVIDDILDDQVPDLQNLALRQYGGPCNGDNSELVVSFGQTNTDTVRGTLQDIAVNGETTLVGAIEQIPEDFRSVANTEGIPNRVIIVTGSGDSCEGDLAEALTGLRNSGIAVVLIGLDIPFDQIDALERAANASGAGILFANNRGGLAGALSTAINQIRGDSGGGGGIGAGGAGGFGGGAGGNNGGGGAAGDAGGSGFGYGN